MYTPSLSDIQGLKATQPGVNLAPVYRDVAADLETPVSAFLKVARGDHSFLLESVEGGERLARYSFIGTEPYRVLRCGPDADPSEGSDPLRELEGEVWRAGSGAGTVKRRERAFSPERRALPRLHRGGRHLSGADIAAVPAAHRRA